MYKSNVANARSHPSSSCRKWRASKMKRVVKLSWIFTGKTQIKANHIPSSFLQNWTSAESKFTAWLLDLKVDSPICSRRAPKVHKNCQNFKANIVITANEGPYATFHWVVMGVFISIVFVVNILIPSIFSWKLVRIRYLPIYKSMKWYLHLKKCVFLPILSSWDDNC